jgi:DNA-binding protein HU-beta
MKKSDLIDAIAARQGMTKTQVQSVVDDVFELVIKGLADGEKVDVRGFGTFSVRDSAARTGRNPQTGAAIEIAARRVPGFKPGKEMRDRVNGDAK